MIHLEGYCLYSGNGSAQRRAIISTLDSVQYIRIEMNGFVRDPSLRLS